MKKIIEYRGKKVASLIIVCVLGFITGLFFLYPGTGTDFTILFKGEKIISPPGIFDSGKADFNARFGEFFDQLAVFLQQNAGLVIEIGGYSDNRGGTAKNQQLSLARAERVKAYLLTKKGINSGRIVTRGYAAASPIAPNQTDAGRAQNRRVEIIALKDVDPAGRLTYIRREVLTRRPEAGDFTRAILNQALYHLYRVLTRDASNANVTFQDFSKINLGPQSLMIMYALLEKDFKLPEKQNVHLLTGGLRTKLNKLKGNLQVETPAAVINSNSVEIIVGIDTKKMSSLSVFDGQSDVQAQGKTVEVKEGFGTVVEMGKEPEPPVPLPPAPRLIKPLETIIHIAGSKTQDMTPVQFAWEEQQDAAAYHLQAATDVNFEQIIEDRVIPANSCEISFPRGSYFWRLAVISKKGLEGYSAQSSFMVSTGKQLPLVISPAPQGMIHTAQKRGTISGKTLPGALIVIRGNTVPVDAEGKFSTTVALDVGLNNIKVQVSHRGYTDTVLWAAFYRSAQYRGGWIVGLRYDHDLEENGDVLYDTAAFFIGRTIPLVSWFAAEFSVAMTTLSWKYFPGDYKLDAFTIPLSLQFHLAPFNGKVFPYLTAGMTGYLAFPKNRFQEDAGHESKFLLAPEIGGGIGFPISGSVARLEVKYAPFLAQEPFFKKRTGRFSVALKLTLK